MPRFNKKPINYKERFHSKKKAPSSFFCKLRIDKKTIIFVRTEESYNDWMAKFPKAERVELPC